MNSEIAPFHSLVESFVAAEQEWLEIIAPPDIPWDEAVADMMREQDALISAGSWIGGPSDMLSIIGKSRWETFHSAVVAWLLWPTAEHRLGIGMLRRVVERCFPDIELDDDILMRCTTATEVSRANSRADIVVNGPGLKIVIEAKVDASEGHNQCGRLHLDHVDDGALFVFLTPSGVKAKTAGQDIESWAPLSFRDIRDDLGACLAAAAPHPGGGRATAASYLATLKKEFR